MSKIISELNVGRAANENLHNSDWISQVPDDWSHVIDVTSEYPVMNRRNKNMHAANASANNNTFDSAKAA